MAKRPQGPRMALRPVRSRRARADGAPGSREDWLAVGGPGTGRRDHAPRAPRPEPEPELSLHDAIEIACVEAVGGDPAGPNLAGRLRRECRAVLLGRGISGAQVQVQSTRRGTVVHIVLPPDVQRVRTIHLDFKPGRG